MFTESFLRDTVLPAVESTGGATVLTSPYGMPPSLLVMDKYQPPTWVVGYGVQPDVAINSDGMDPANLAAIANCVYADGIADSWSGVGFWTNDGMLYIEPVRIFTNHYMAVEEARKFDQLAIYAAHTGELEFLAPEHNYVVGADS